MFGKTHFTIPQFPNYSYLDEQKMSPTTRPQGSQGPSISQRVTDRPTSPTLSERYSNKTYNRVPSPVNTWQPRNTGFSRGVAENFKPTGAAIGARKPGQIDGSPRRPAAAKILNKLGSRPTSPTTRGSAGVKTDDKISSRQTGPATRWPTSVRPDDNFSSRQTGPASRRPTSVKTDDKLGSRPTSPASAVGRAEKPRLQEQCSPVRRPSSASQASGSLDDRVIFAVKNALSRVVLERGPIRESDIDTVLFDMRDHLRACDSSTHTSFTLGERPSAEDLGRARPLAGIVRKDLSESVRPVESAYKRVYGGPRRSPSNRVIDDDPDTVLLVDLPNRDDYIRYDDDRKKASEQAEHGRKYSRSAKLPGYGEFGRKEQQENEPPCVEERGCHQTRGQSLAVGDCQPRSSQSFTVWKESDDAQLQRCISKLISRLQIKADALQEGDIETDRHVACKAFCACKVCLGKREDSWRELQEPLSLPKSLQNKSTNTVVSSARSSVGKTPVVRGPKTTAKSEVSRRPDSPKPKTPISLGTQYNPPNQKSHNIDPETETDPGDMYLLRKLRRSSGVNRN